jgi:hypothetical protein
VTQLHSLPLWTHLESHYFRFARLVPLAAAAIFVVFVWRDVGFQGFQGALLVPAVVGALAISVCLLYWYKSANTDAAGAAGGRAGYLSLLALLVQKCKY